MIIGIDFDGTCVTHEFPNIGKDIGAIPILKELVNAGHKLILYTMRSDIDNPKSNSAEIIPQPGTYLSDAIEWFNKNGIELYAANENPEQRTWTTSPKVYCHLYIDDAGLGIPLKFDKNVSNRPFVDWEKVRILLQNRNIL